MKGYTIVSQYHWELRVGDTRLTLTPSVTPNSNYVIMVGD